MDGDFQGRRGGVNNLRELLAGNVITRPQTSLKKQVLREECVQKGIKEECSWFPGTQATHKATSEHQTNSEQPSYQNTQRYTAKQYNHWNPPLTGVL